MRIFYFESQHMRLRVSLLEPRAEKRVSLGMRDGFFFQWVLKVGGTLCQKLLRLVWIDPTTVLLD